MKSSRRRRSLRRNTGTRATAGNREVNMGPSGVWHGVVSLYVMGNHITAGNGITGVWYSYGRPTHYWRFYGRRFGLILRLYGCGIYFGGRLYGSLEESTKGTLQAEPGQTTMRDRDRPAGRQYGKTRSFFCRLRAVQGSRYQQLRSNVNIVRSHGI